MDRADGAGYRVVEQEDDAVRREDHQVQPRLVRHQGVGGEVVGLEEALAPVRGGDMAHRVPVDLVGLDHVVDVRAESGAEAAAVLPDILPAVRVRAAAPEVQGRVYAPAHAAQAGGEAVDGLPVLQNRGGVVCDARGGLDEK